MPHPFSRGRILIAGLALVVFGALTQAAVAPADAAAAAPGCTDSWASPVSGAWTSPANWTNGVPTSSAVACIVVSGIYQVTLPAGDSFANQVVLGDGTGAGQESLVLPGCGATGSPNNRLYVSTLDVAPGGVLDMQYGQSCPGSQTSLNAVLATSTNTPMTLGGTVLAEGPESGTADYLIASSISNLGTITDNTTLHIDALTPVMTFGNRGIINGSDFLGLGVPQTGVTMTNAGSISGAVSFLFTTVGGLGTTGSTFANNLGGDIGTGGYVQMGAGTTFTQSDGTTSGSGAAVATDGSSLDIVGSGAALLQAFGTVSLTGDIRPGQELDIMGESEAGGSTCASPENATVNATGSFNNSGTITLRSAGSTACPPGSATLTVPTGDAIINQGIINASALNAVAARTISGEVDNTTGTVNVDPGIHLAISPGSVDNSAAVNVNGTLAVGGGYTQEAAGTTSVAVGSKFGSASLSATGAASLAGTLALAGDGVTPPQGSSATLLSAGSVSGTFGTVTGTDAGNGLTYQIGYTPATVTATVTGPKPPRAFTISSSGSLKIIDRATNTVLTTANVGGPGDAVAVTPDGSRLYVADDKNRLDVVNAATGTVGTPIGLTGSPDAVVVSPDGSTVYAVDAAGHLDVVAAATGTVKSVIKVGGIPEGVAVSPDGTKVYVADAAGNLDVVNAVTDTVSSVVKTGGRPAAVAVSPSGTTVYLASATGQLIAVGAATGTVTARVKTGGLPDAVAVSPDGTSVYLADATGHLVTVNASTAKVTRRVAVAGAPNAVALSPGGATVYVTGAKATKLFVIAAATGKIQATVPIGSGAAGVAVS